MLSSVKLLSDLFIGFVFEASFIRFLLSLEGMLVPNSYLSEQVFVHVISSQLILLYYIYSSPICLPSIVLVTSFICVSFRKRECCLQCSAGKTSTFRISFCFLKIVARNLCSKKGQAELQTLVNCRGRTAGRLLEIKLSVPGVVFIPQLFRTLFFYEENLITSVNFRQCVNTCCLNLVHPLQMQAYFCSKAHRTRVSCF